MQSMPSESKIVALFHIRDNILFAREFVDAMTFEQFARSRLHFYAVARALKIISEAGCRLTEEFRGRHPNLPWRAIRDVGNF